MVFYRLKFNRGKYYVYQVRAFRENGKGRQEQTYIGALSLVWEDFPELIERELRKEEGKLEKTIREGSELREHVCRTKIAELSRFRI